MTATLNQDTLLFIEQHANDDVRQLALAGHKYPHVDMPWALNQIRGRQIATVKLPLLARISGIHYPAHLSMEQCSSQTAAHYKLRVARSLTGNAERRSITDLTGGFGIDFLAISTAFRQATYVERSPELCALMQHNLGVLGREAQVMCMEAEQAIGSIEPQTLIYIDPARRNAAGGRTYAIADCTPDVLTLMTRMLEKARWVMVKLSPMLDWHQAVKALGCVSQVHIVSVNGECKELLLVCTAQQQDNLTIFCADNRKVWTFTPTAATPIYTKEPIAAGQYLYEPNASVMKSGLMAQVCLQYHTQMIAPNSNLFISQEPVDGFPGRRFHIKAVSTLNKKQLRTTLAGIDRANITVRNMPLSVDYLRKKLHLKDGGGTYIFGTTAQDGNHILLVCEKI